MRKLVRESMYTRFPEPNEKFLEWIDLTMKENPDVDWEFVISTLVNDESSSDEDLRYYLIENGVEYDLIDKLLSKRTGFLNHGLEIEI